MTYEQLTEKITSVIEMHQKELKAYSDDVFEHPELSGQEYETSKKIVKLLTGHGYECEYPYAGIETSFRAISGHNNHKYKIAVVTEYDALPEVGHACGHNLSGAISMLAGIATRDLQDELNADIHIVGTPTEETDGKKCQMVDEGYFDEYDFAIMVHLYNCNMVVPKLQCLAGRMYNFWGKSAHASAAPWDGINALNASQLFVHAIDMMRQHVLPETQFHGIYHHGGDAPNIVPEHVLWEQYIRSTDRNYLVELEKMVDRCAEGACIATGAKWDKYQKDADYYNMKPNKTGETAIAEVFGEIGLEINGDPDKLFGSSDMGNVSWVCPAFQPTLQITESAPIHTREFANAVKSERAGQALVDGAKLIAFTIAKIFNDTAKIEMLKADFDR